jgi:hypothetical protein
VPPRSSDDRGRRVFLVHGRDRSARHALIALLEAFDLKVIRWRDAAEFAGGGAPYTGDVVAAGMENADAVVVLLTPDDLGRVRSHLSEVADGPHELKPTGQARLNVIFEAGMAIARDRNRVVFVEAGQVRKMSDVDGINVIRMDGSIGARKDLARRLSGAGLAVDTDSDKWRTAGNFTTGFLTSPSDGSVVNRHEAVRGVITGLYSDDQALTIVQSPRSGEYWSQTIVQPDREGRFTVRATFGRYDEADNGKQYNLLLILATPADSAVLKAAMGHSIPSLPPDVRILDQASVIRHQIGSSNPG